MNESVFVWEIIILDLIVFGRFLFCRFLILNKRKDLIYIFLVQKSYLEYKWLYVFIGIVKVVLINDEKVIKNVFCYKKVSI